MPVVAVVGTPFVAGNNGGSGAATHVVRLEDDDYGKDGGVVELRLVVTTMMMTL